MNNDGRFPLAPRSLSAGDSLFDADGQGPLWRLTSGAIRLDEPRGRHNTVVRIALPGDLLGAELFCQSRYAFTAVAMTDCLVEQVGAGSLEDRVKTVSDGFLQQQQRLVDMVRMRRGPVAGRVQVLLDLLGFHAASASTGRPRGLPSLRDMAAMVDSAPETVCRILGALSEPLLREQTLSLGQTGRRRRSRASAQPLLRLAA